MAYETYEQSTNSGQPIEAYDIQMGIIHWYITPNGESFDLFGHEYESTPCKRSEIEQTSEIPKDSIDLELPRGHALGTICIAGAPEEEITLTIYRGHSNFFVTYFRGFLTSITFDKDSIPKCHFEPKSSDLPFVGGRRRCMRLCGHKLYGYRCGLDNEAFKINGTIDTISGTTITSSEFGAVATPEPAVFGDLCQLTGCIYSASVESSTAVKAFDNNFNTIYVKPDVAGFWIQCQWTNAQTIKKVNIYPYAWSAGEHADRTIKYFRVLASNNGSSWTVIPVMQWFGRCAYYGGEGGSDTEIEHLPLPNDVISVVLDNDTAYKYWRIQVYDNWGGSQTWVRSIEMFEADSSMDIYQFGSGGEIVIGTARRMIISHVGDTITINRPFGVDVIAGSAFSAYMGCDHTPGCCRDKFNNILNYGGQELLPVKNPYTGRDSLDY